MKNTKNKKKFFVQILMITFIMFLMTNTIFAADDWWGKATDWYKGGSTTVGLSTSVIDGIADLVEMVGTGVIAIATVVIGIKYMMGTVQGKTEAKESMISLLVACLFFFGWTSIRGLLITGNATGQGGLSGATTGLVFFDGDLKVTFARIFTLVVTIGKVLSVLAIVYIGVKYVFAGADAKAQLKQKSPAMIIGIILIFCATTFLGIVAKVITEVI